jgi:hypothetical protein
VLKTTTYYAHIFCVWKFRLQSRDNWIILFHEGWGSPGSLNSWGWNQLKNHLSLAWLVVDSSYQLKWAIFWNTCTEPLFLSFFSVIGGSGCWSQGFVLTRQALYHLSHPLSHFHIDYFWDRTLLYTLTDLVHNIVFPQEAKMTGMCHHIQPLVGMGVSQTFVQANLPQIWSSQSLPPK